MLIDRLIFGCGHLTGGASQRDAARLVRRAREAGIGQFDTAPSYGIGTAEDAIGRLVGNDAAVRIIAFLCERLRRTTGLVEDSAFLDT